MIVLEELLHLHQLEQLLLRLVQLELWTHLQPGQQIRLVWGLAQLKIQLQQLSHQQQEIRPLELAPVQLQQEEAQLVQQDAVQLLKAVNTVKVKLVIMNV